MNPQMQFNLSHIIGQTVDVSNYTAFQHQLHGYGNINTISNISNLGNASTLSAGTQSLSVQNIEMAGGPITAGSGMVTVGYAQQQQQQQPNPVQSYHTAVFNSMTVAHVSPQVPAPQVQYFSYEAPCVTIRPHTSTQIAHQVPPTQTIDSQGSAKYSSCSVSFQTVSSAVPLGSAMVPRTETLEDDAINSSAGIRETKRKRNNEGISAKHNRKSLRNRGEAYLNASGKYIEAKRYVDKDCECKSKCLLKLGTAADRETIFRQFWSIGNFSQQNAYLTENVTLVPMGGKKCKVPASDVDEKNLKTVKRIYCVKLLNSNKKTRVCKAMFLSLHGISNGRLDRVLQAVNCEFPHALQDRRGQHTPSNKTSEEDVRYVVEHIASMRQGMETSGLSPPACIPVQGLQNRLSAENAISGGKETSVKKMYGTYKRLCKEEGRSPVSLWVYRRIEKNQFSQENSSRIDETLPNNDLLFERTCVTQALCTNSENKILTINDMNVCSNNDLGGNKDAQEVTTDTKNNSLVSVTFDDKKSEGCKTVMTRGERKSKRNSGSSYYTATGKYKNEKRYVDKECGCKYRCIPALGTLDVRQKIFWDFWKLANFSKQSAYIAEKVVLAPVVQKCTGRVTEKYAKTCSRLYYVQLKEGEDVVRVCKMAFLNLHGVSNGRVDRVLQAVACKSPFALKDRRGHHSPKNKTGEEDLNYASSHIRSFLKEFPSDDGCGTNRLYLPQDFNIQKMYRFYKETCLQSGRIPVGCFVYRKVLKERFDCYIRSPANKTPEVDLEHAYQHIISCMSNVSVLQEAVDPGIQANTLITVHDTSVKKLHRDYIQKCMQEARKPVGIDVYRKMFNSKFDVSKILDF